MYLSKIRLVNWRSYADQTFEFPKPTAKKPLVLVGAMNGHGKTSLLLALYIGMYGRFGVRYCEGLNHAAESDTLFYRKYLKMFRRNDSDQDQPTSVELCFSPTIHDETSEEIRLVRTWYFTSSGSPKLGDSFEELRIYSNEKPLRIPDVDLGTDRLSRLLFPAHVMPAFFFDGEQAQTLITSAGTPGIKKAIEVMFGTKVLEEVHQEVRNFINLSHSRVGGKRTTTKLEDDLDTKTTERERLNKQIAQLQQKEIELGKLCDQIDHERKAIEEKISLLGGKDGQGLSALQERLKNTQKRLNDAERSIKDSVRSLGVNLALSRFHVALRNRLEAEDQRETWEQLRKGTLERADQVLDAAIPEPPERDELLGNLSGEVRTKVRGRFRNALDQIYNPPPQGCASEYLHGHVTGEQRKGLLENLHRHLNQNEDQLRKKVQELRSATNDYEDAKARVDSFANLPQALEEMANELKRLNNDKSEAYRRLHQAESEVKKLKADLHALSAEIGQLTEQLAKFRPEQKRIAVAERVNRVLDGLLTELKPFAIKHLEKAVTRHYSEIIDQRFKDYTISIPDEGSPELRDKSGKVHLVETMSGFERRSFGIAFSLALAELTQRRLPLVIDTPLGNADSDYRPRLLKALTNVDLDQIIMLTHDEEVNGKLLSAVDHTVSAKFLIKFDDASKQSKVHANSYFGNNS